jgi:hypothetical protein
MFILTKQEGSIESGAYATIDTDGITMVQFFVDKDDAISYNTLLGAVGFELQVTETPDESIDKLCDMLGHAYSVVEPGEVVVPSAETLVDTLSSYL